VVYVLSDVEPPMLRSTVEFPFTRVVAPLEPPMLSSTVEIPFIAYSPLALSSQLKVSHPADHHLDILKSKNDIHYSGLVSSSSLKLKQRSRLDLPGHAFGSGKFSTLIVYADCF
jgi:hypothetical protein